MSRSLKKISLIISFGTLSSKLGGLARQLVIAGAFGVGAAYDSYSYAYVVPGFFLILLGGINGPFHNAMVSVLSKRTKKEGAYVLAAINTLIGTSLLLITVIIFLGAEQIIYLLAPGLNKEVHTIATTQLQVMSPIALLSGLIGLGFGSLNARDEYLIPAISPLATSTTLIFCTAGFWLLKNQYIPTQHINLIGGVVLAGATLGGALMQLLIQLPVLIKKEIIKFKLIWDFKHEGVKEVLKIIGPATLSSGMLQINVFTDLFFASSIAAAAASLSYASFLIQAPLGLISNALIIPLLPVFAKLSNYKDTEPLISRIRQGLIISTAAMIALGSIFIAIGEPLVSLIYQRGAFEETAVSLVSSLLIAYGIGMPAYLARDLLVRIFYSLGDAKTPFRLSVLGIVLNIIFDWIFIGGPSPWGNQLPFNLGAPGLVLATALINVITCLALLSSLKSLLKGIPLKIWAFDIIKLLIAGMIGGISAWQISSTIIWPIGFIGTLLNVGISSTISSLIFVFICNYFGISEVRDLIYILKKKIIHQ